MTIQYTVRGVPDDVDSRLRELAHATGKSLNTVIVERLAFASLPPTPPNDDLDWFIGAVDGEFVAEQEAAQAWLDALPRELGHNH